MSEYTTVYLRSKVTPLLDYREHPSFEETRNLSKDEIMTAIHEVDEYNKNVRESFGCELFHLSTTPSRQLDVLQWSSSPQTLTAELLDRVFFKNAHQARNREMVDRSHLVVFCVQRESGGAWQTMKYARRQGAPLINIQKWQQD